jgi:hypothetical protein
MKKAYYGYKTANDALNARNLMVLKYEKEQEQILLNTPVKRNKQGLPIIELFDMKYRPI